MKIMPVGIHNFKELILGKKQTQYYYVDKTMLLKEILTRGMKVNLIPRPRRFGKSLNLDMIRQFVDINGDPSLFRGLKIAEDEEFCRDYQCQYPVLHFNMKDVFGDTFQAACRSMTERLSYVVRSEYSFLQNSAKLDDSDKYLVELYSDMRLWVDDWGGTGKSLSVSKLEEALPNLCMLLWKHYGLRTVVLIDEYDVPLNSAWSNNYYDEMIAFVRNMFSKLLNDNDTLDFAVLTGCLRVSKESIFTGMNNFRVWSASSDFSSDYFGFTEAEVKTMLDYYGLCDAYETVKKWYDGFRFGHEFLYCPWDVIGYVDKCNGEHAVAEPEMYWNRSSGNDILGDLLKNSTQFERDLYHKLVNGKTIKAQIMDDMTYRDLNDPNSIWSLLTASGYLTVVSRTGTNAELRAPNLEVRTLLANQYNSWIQTYKGITGKSISEFCDAFPIGNVDTITKKLTTIFTSMLHMQDMRRQKKQRESLYHGIIMTLLFTSWPVKSNLESGEGFCDISFRTKNSVGVVIEVKDSIKRELKKDAQEALDQIEKREYFRELVDFGCKEIFEYGIACRYHSVFVKMKRYNPNP